MSWSSADGSKCNQIDHICINQKWRESVKAITGADVGSDNLLMLCRLKLKLQKATKEKEGTILWFRETWGSNSGEPVCHVTQQQVSRSRGYTCRWQQCSHWQHWYMQRSSTRTRMYLITTDRNGNRRYRTPHGRSLEKGRPDANRKNKRNRHQGHNYQENNREAKRV